MWKQYLERLDVRPEAYAQLLDILVDPGNVSLESRQAEGQGWRREGLDPAGVVDGRLVVLQRPVHDARSE